MEVLVNDQKVFVENLRVVGDRVQFSLGGRMYTFTGKELDCFISPMSKDHSFQVFSKGKEAIITIAPKVSSAGNRSLSEGSLVSPMPGKVFKVMRKVGEKVAKGDAILIIEAMKMEHTIRAGQDGTISDIFFKEGEQVDGGVSLAEIE